MYPKTQPKDVKTLSIMVVPSKKPSVSVLRVCRTMYDEAVQIVYGDNNFMADDAKDQSDQILSSRQLEMVRFLTLQILSRGFDSKYRSNIVDHYVRACPSLKTLKLEIGIMWPGWAPLGSAESDRLKDIALPASRLCDKVAFEVWDDEVSPEHTYTDPRDGYAAQEQWLPGPTHARIIGGLAWNMGPFHRSWVLHSHEVSLFRSHTKCTQ